MYLPNFTLSYNLCDKPTLGCHTPDTFFMFLHEKKKIHVFVVSLKMNIIRSVGKIGYQK